jgi:hypothetical protein
MTAHPLDDAATSVTHMQQVEVTFVARPDMAVLARMTAAAVAARADFGVDQVEDLRLAIDELCVTMMGEDGAAGRLSVLFDWSEDAVSVTGRLQGARGATRRRVPSALSERILDALVDDHGIETTGPDPCMWFIVRRRGTP